MSETLNRQSQKDIQINMERFHREKVVIMEYTLKPQCDITTSQIKRHIVAKVNEDSSKSVLPDGTITLENHWAVSTKAEYKLTPWSRHSSSGYIFKRNTYRYFSHYICNCRKLETIQMSINSRKGE